MMTFGTEAMIAELVELNSDMSAKQRHLLRESLRSLVRLAKTEQVMEIKANVRKLVGTGLQVTSRKKRATDELASYGNQQMQFNDFE